MVEQATDVRDGPAARPPVDDVPWWSEAVGYEVYLRSFADGNGDGIGDLVGLATRLEHLADLGVDIVWVTPFYPSPMADFGYDVADHRDVDPRFGTLADFDCVVARAHELGLRVMIDIVPNHTSDQHPWFRRALAEPASPERHRYIWADPSPDGGPPNNWVSHFGGPAWTLDDASGQYWCHLFLPEQPDLDWDHPAVRAEFVDILSFWLARGVDGFRIDVAHALVKDPARRDNPVIEDVSPDASPRRAFWAQRHDHDLDQPGVLDVYREWHAVTAAHDAVLLGEVYLLDPARVGRYVADGDGLDLAFYFPVLHTRWDPAQLRTVVVDALRHGGGRFTWVHSSHDDPRAPTRFGGGDRGRRRALAFLAFTAFLPGPLFLYQGDELGLENGIVPDHRAADPVAVRNDDASDGRDPVRTPMPWSAGLPGLGFSSVEPWLPIGENHTDADTVDAQRDDPDSTLHRVRALLALRRDHRGLPTAVEWLDTRPDVLAYRRGHLIVVLNAGDRPVALDVVDGGHILLSTADRSDDAAGMVVPADAAVVVEGR